MVARREPTEVVLHDLEAERVVLGACLGGGAATARTLKRLRPESFSTAEHQLIHETCVDLHRHGAAVSADRVTQELARRSWLGKVGGPEYLARLASAPVTPGDWERSVELVADHALRRRLLALSNVVADWATDLTVLAEDAVEDLIAKLGVLLNGPREDRLVSWAEVQEGVLADLAPAVRVESESGPTGADRAAPDQIIGSIGDGELVVVGSRPGMGMRALAIGWAEHRVSAGTDVVYFSLGMPADELWYGYGSGAEVTHEKCGSNAWLQLADADSPAEREPPDDESALWVHDRSDLSLGDLEAACRWLERHGLLGLVVVDYLQLLRGDEPHDSRERQLAIIARRLRSLATDLAVPVIVLSQLSPGSRPDRRPWLGDLDPCGALAEEADRVLLLHRPEASGVETAQIAGTTVKTTGLAELVVATDPDGPSNDSVWLRWDPELRRFGQHPLQRQLER